MSSIKQETVESESSPTPAVQESSNTPIVTDTTGGALETNSTTETDSKTDSSTTTSTEEKQDKKPPNYKVVSDDDLYRHSSQYKFWSFTPQELQEKRLDINSRAVSSIEQDLRTFKQANMNELYDERLKLFESRTIPLTMEEEQKMVIYYAKKVQLIAQHLNLPTEVVATAITFFKRFFLENSVMQIDPKVLVPTTIFFACKSENYFIGVDSFAKKTKSKRETILKYEFQLLEALKFTLFNHHPYKALHGFFLDIQAQLYEKVDLKYMGQLYENCKRAITNALHTDIAHFYTPPQIALATLFIEDEALVRRYLQEKFEPVISENTSPTKGRRKKTAEQEEIEEEERLKKLRHPVLPLSVSKLLSLIEECKKLIENPIVVTIDDAKRMAAKSFYCQNPMSLIQTLNKRTQEQDESSEKKQNI